MQGAAKLSEDTLEGGSESHSTNKFNAKSILSNTIKFKLSNRSESDLPVNTRSIKVDSNIGSKINKYIAPKSTEKAYSLCKLYDQSLKEQE